MRSQSSIKDPSIVPPDETPEQKAAREKLLHRDHEMKEEAQELAIHFNNRLVDSLLRCIRNSLDAIKRRVFPAYVMILALHFLLPLCTACFSRLLNFSIKIATHLLSLSLRVNVSLHWKERDKYSNKRLRPSFPHVADSADAKIKKNAQGLINGLTVEIRLAE